MDSEQITHIEGRKKTTDYLERTYSILEKRIAFSIDKEKISIPLYALIIIFLFIFSIIAVAFAVAPLAIMAPNTDVTGYIAKVKIQNKEFSASGNTWSKKFRNGDKKEWPDISVTLSWQKCSYIGETPLTFQGEQYKVFKWNIKFSLRVQAVSQPPWWEGPSWNNPTGCWVFDGTVKVTVTIKITARTDWRFMWATTYNIIEVTKFNQKPEDSWTTTIHYGDAKADEPNSINAYIKGSNYATRWEEYWSQFNIQKQPATLIFSCTLDAPSWVKDNWLAGDNEGAGYAYVQWDFDVKIAYDRRIDPNTGDVEGELKDPERSYAKSLAEDIPLWFLAIIVIFGALFMIALVIMIGKIVGRRKRGYSPMAQPVFYVPYSPIGYAMRHKKLSILAGLIPIIVFMIIILVILWFVGII